MDIFGWKKRLRAHIEREEAVRTASLIQSTLSGFPADMRSALQRLEAALHRTIMGSVKNSYAEIGSSESATLSTWVESYLARLRQKQLLKPIEKAADNARKAMIVQIRENAEEIFRKIIERRAVQLWTGVKEALEEQSPVQGTGFGVLHKGTRFFYKSKACTIFVVEQEPMVRTTTFTVENKSTGRLVNQSFRLTFPFVVFLIKFKKDQFESLHLFFRNKPLKGLDDTLYHPALPNVYQGTYLNQVCFHGLNEEEAKLPVAEQIAVVLQKFWGSTFNSDLTFWFNKSQKRIQRIQTLEKWQKCAEEIPTDILECDWFKADTVRYYLNALFRDALPGREAPIDMVNQVLGLTAHQVGQDIAAASLGLVPKLVYEEAVSVAITQEWQTFCNTAGSELERVCNVLAEKIHQRLPRSLEAGGEREQLLDELMENLSTRLRGRSRLFRDMSLPEA